MNEARPHQPRSNLQGRKVLVTGAGGFIGSHLTEELVRQGASVTAMIKYNSLSSWGCLELSDERIKKEINVVGGTVEDSDFMRSVINEQELVYHLAALIPIPYSYLAPRSYVRTNIEGTLNVLESARRLGVERVIHTSTSEVYGTAVRVPIDEQHPLQAQSPYSATKIGADKIAESYFRSFSTPVVTIRPFNTFGPRQSARAFIPAVISQALEAPTVMLGSREPQRDMTYVDDIVNGFLAAGTAPRMEGETINLGTGSTHSVGFIADKILELVPVSKPIVHDPARDRPANSEVMKLVADISKAQRLLGWAPKVAMEEGLLRTIDFVSRHRTLYKPQFYAL